MYVIQTILTQNKMPERPYNSGNKYKNISILKKVGYVLLFRSRLYNTHVMLWFGKISCHSFRKHIGRMKY